uniref:Spliceosome associated factor 3, U4/U6 recycling protein n=1 Tax=Scleropages formosus TaxID=113540 RepID=A0A8C9R698_SCLFO
MTRLFETERRLSGLLRSGSLRGTSSLLPGRSSPKMAAKGSEEKTQFQEMEEEATSAAEKDIESEQEEGMGVEDSSEEEDESSEDEKENEAEIQRLEEQLSINAFDYNCHVDLIKLLRQEGELLRLRRARQKMSELFPLTEEIWLDWLKDEIRMTEEEPNRGSIYELFERAVKDYICPEIWLEYAQYSIGGMGAPGGIDKVRSIFERALMAVGLHMTKGAALWEAYREFENAILATLVAEPPKLAEYQAYIDYELKEGDPARIQIIFERALVENCLVPDLWAKCTKYLDRQLKIRDLVLSCHDRAVRNCPWTMDLWRNYLLALERHGAEHQVVTGTFEKALNAGFIQATDYVDIWQAYLDYLRRRVDFTKESSQQLEELRAAFTRALDYMKQDVEERFSESGDPSCTIMQIWARIEALHCKNIQKARELWDNIMTKGNAKYANMWLEYYNLERSYGDALHCRKALHRAVQCTSDYPEHVCEVLLTFERVEGSLEDWDIAVQKTETRLTRVIEQRAKVAEKEALLAQQEEEKTEQRKKAKAEKKAQKKTQKMGRTGEKRKAEDDDEGEEWGEESEQPAKKHRGEGDPSLEDAATEELMETESGLYGRKTGETLSSRKARVAAEVTRRAQDAARDKRDDGASVFVSNLAFSMEDPEKKMRDLFQDCGSIEQIRPIYNTRGTFRGYCYVQFEDKASVPNALKLDRREVDGRPMFVSPCVDKNKNPNFKVFKYSTTLEKHKLFISGLPYSCTREQLDELCKEHGTVKDIRLVTNRSGKPKGLAYVEYEDEAQASHAVLKMDGMLLEGHTLTVAISNPPRRNVLDKPDGSRAPGAVMPRQVYGARGKGRTQLSMLPRALNRQAGAEPKAENGTLQNPGTAGASGFEAQTKSLSNADFSRMLNKK